MFCKGTHGAVGLAAAATLVLLGAGCKEDPSFRARWALATAPDGMPHELTSSSQCSTVGVMAIRVTTRDELGLVVDSRLRPCFPPGFEDPEDAIDGPTLDPGIYAVEVRGVRRDDVGWTRTLIGEPTGDFPCEPVFGVPIGEQDPQCDPSFVACDCRALQVRGDETTTLDDFALRPPAQCVDGVDNDRDGLVDDFDPACASAGLNTTEDAQISDVRVSVQLTVLDENPTVLCSSLRLSRFEISLDDMIVAEPICSDYLGRRFAFNIPLAAGLHTLRVTARNPGGDALTITKEYPIEITAVVGDSFDFDVDFGVGDFLEDIVAPAEVSLDFVSRDGVDGRQCTPGVTGGELDITDLRLEVLDAHGGTVSPPVETASGVPLDGSLLPCSDGLATQEVSWGGYLLELEALSAQGEVCFSNVTAEAMPTPLAPSAPNSPSRIAIPRVYPVPDSCRDCNTNADCEPPFVCDADGVCSDSG